jgi:hypothetical protein
VLKLLETKPFFDSEYDPKNSPLALFILKSIGFREIPSLMMSSKQFFAAELGCEALLDRIPKAVVNVIEGSLFRLGKTQQGSPH